MSCGAAGVGGAAARELGVGPVVRRAGLRAAGGAAGPAARGRLARVPRHGRLHAARRLALQRLPRALRAARRRREPLVSAYLLANLYISWTLQRSVHVSDKRSVSVTVTLYKCYDILINPATELLYSHHTLLYHFSAIYCYHFIY